MAIENLRQVRCPAPFVALLSWVWPAQVGWLQIGRSVLPTPARVTTSVPQGCQAAPMALTALLISTAQRVQRCTEGPLQQSIFVDDRELDKFRIVARRMTQKLQSAGFGVSEQAVVLGTNFRSENRVDKLGAEFFYGEPLRLVQRLAKLPVRPSARELLYRTRFVPKMMWGTWYADWDLSDTSKFVIRVRRAAGVVQMGARAL
ncbi:hypothetical protein AK812_SmicGene8406 [Symbiodinium microadriaticum]|uniref:Uncharacterized protein n=1 Tax=Symbiodinium microadriaticum TaxID=2951 RepID=A0A1Q9EL75_SYMMI|nr:hypothetical protein AK812_SmicGene8406 [Symbiodinium microadriaticum]CAE7450800.1 unnamed protein product [Symbiodinium microadriaticum]